MAQSRAPTARDSPVKRLFRNVNDQFHVGMDRAFDLHFSRLAERPLVRLVLPIGAQIKAIAVGQRKHIMKVRVFILEMHRVAGFYF